MAEADEETLLRRCKAGDDAAWEELIARYSGAALAAVRSALGRRGRTRDAALEQELVADTFAALAQDDAANLRSFRGESSFAKFVSVIAARRAYREIRSRVRRDRATERAERELAGRLAGDDPTAGAEEAERRSEVAAALAKLPPADMLLLTAYYLDGLSYEEVAALVGGQATGIGTRLRRARERLREALGRDEEEEL